jgi:hypothetical protein
VAAFTALTALGDIRALNVSPVRRYAAEAVRERELPIAAG